MPELEREKEERKDAELACAGYRRQLASLRDRSSEIMAEIEQHRATVASSQWGARHDSSLAFVVDIRCREGPGTRNTEHICCTGSA